MSATIQSLGIDRLSVEERLTLVREIWDSLATDGVPCSLTGEQRQELRRRVDEDDADPNGLIPLDEVTLSLGDWLRPEEDLAWAHLQSVLERTQTPGSDLYEPPNQS